jgi:organic radical activating enzyme
MNTWCVYPWINLHTNTDGRCKLCCHIYTEDYIQHEGRDAILGKDPWEAIWYGAHMKNVRNKMTAGEKLKECNRCYEHEEKGLESSRQWANKEFANRWARTSGGKEMEVYDPVNLELRLGNVCNLKCAGCWSVSSDQLYNERKLITSQEQLPEWLSSQWNHELESVERFDWNWFETEEFEYFIDSVVPGLKRLYLTGGEPTLINMNRVILDKLIKAGNNECYVCWTTNLTNWPPEFYDKLDFFDASEVQMSIDGFEMSNTYMRYPTNWKAVEKNFEKAQQLPEKCILKVYFVYQAWNIFDVKKVIRWIEQNQRRRVDFAPIYLESPDWIHSCIWPPHVKEEVCEELQFETNYKNATQSIINYTMNTDKYSKERMNKMVYYISILDKYRKHKFKDIFPELDFIIQHETTH